MTLQNGTFSLTRYRVLGRSRRFTVAEFNQKFSGFQARPINLKGHAHELSFGWVAPHNPEMDPEDPIREHWDISDCLYEDGILLRFRIERRTVSAILLQEMVRQRWASLDPQLGGDDPQRLRKKQVIDEVRDELLSMSLPSMSFVDLFWQDQDDCIYLFSQSKMAIQGFEELFQKTFGQPLKLSLFRLIPPLLGIAPEVWASDKSDWMDRLKRTLPLKTGYERASEPTLPAALSP